MPKKTYCIEFYKKKDLKSFGRKVMQAYSQKQVAFLFNREFGNIFTIEKIRSGMCKWKLKKD